jgi:hypothetical protein
MATSPNAAYEQTSRLRAGTPQSKSTGPLPGDRIGLADVIIAMVQPVKQCGRVAHSRWSAQFLFTVELLTVRHRSRSRDEPCGSPTPRTQSGPLERGPDMCGRCRIRTCVGVSRRIYSPLPLAARATCRCCAKSRPGFGASSRVQRGWSQDENASRIGRERVHGGFQLRRR